MGLVRVRAEFRGVLCCPATSFVVTGTDRKDTHPPERPDAAATGTAPARRGPQEGDSMGIAGVGAGEGSEPCALGCPLVPQTPSQNRLELLRVKCKEFEETHPATTTQPWKYWRSNPGDPPPLH